MSPEVFTEYAGLNYRGASLEGARLIAQANASGSWCNGLPERLIALRSIMQREAFREGVQDYQPGKTA